MRGLRAADDPWRIRAAVDRGNSAGYRRRAARRTRNCRTDRRERPAATDRAPTCRAGTAMRDAHAAVRRCRRPCRSYHVFEHELADFVDGLSEIESLGADLDTNHDGVTAKQTVRPFELAQALGRGLIAAVGEKTIRLQQRRGAAEFIGIPPERRACGGAACAEYAFVQTVELVALRRALPVFHLGLGLVHGEPGFHRTVLVPEQAQVHHEVAYHGHARQRPDLHGLFQILQWRNTREPVAAVAVHAVRTAHAFTA